MEPKKLQCLLVSMTKLMIATGYLPVTNELYTSLMAFVTWCDRISLCVRLSRTELTLLWGYRMASY